MSKIARVEMGRLDYEMVGEFKFFPPDPDGRTHRPTYLVRLTDENGIQGWGQSVPVPSWTYETTETVETTLRLYLAPAVLGADPSDLAEIHRRMDRVITPSFSVGQPLCKAGIDLACYDLWGKQTGQSVSVLLGGAQKTELELGWTVQSPTLAGAQKQLELGRALGYRSFNVKIGAPQTPAYDIELARLVCRFAPNGFHWVDANTHYDIASALDVAPKLADAGIRAWESPLPPNRIRDYQALTRQGAIPVYMDEGIVSPVEVAEFIALRMFNGVTMKVARCGGLWNCYGIVKLLQEHHIPILASGLTDPDLSLAASVHLFAWAGLDTPAALNGPEYLAGRGTADPSFRPEANVVLVPTSPGLGLNLDPRAESVLKVVAEA
jgi:L-alanine-DL-glutamate epimerase-like enolase superfamily enzyme